MSALGPGLRIPARFSRQDLTRPPRRWHDATTRLLDFALITYAVEPAALAALLPPGMTPDVYTLDSGRQVAFISAVPFRDADFHFHFAPWMREAMGQTNYRAYIRYRGRRAVWFFGTTLTGMWRWVPRHLWRLPWHHATMGFDTAWEGGHCEWYRMVARSEWGPAALELRGLDEPMGRVDGFADAEETLVVLTHPLTGYYYRRDQTVGSYSVWHDQLRPWRMEVQLARFEVFERLGLIEPEQPPHSAVALPATQFVIHLPPARLLEHPSADAEASARARLLQSVR